ncbi:MAG: B12-binding domain-containing radical SAM protein, partial [Candidatus Omnitrophica bacterium]|nr:B12-binding domain-containing radical SAM protein [Candidatus Omnitrophota bacterium]
MLATEKLYKNALCVYPSKIGTPDKKYCPPIGIEYIAAALENLVDKIALIDMRFESNLDSCLQDKSLDLACLSICWDFQLDAALDIIARIPAQVKVVVGGRYSTTYVEELFAASANIDIIVRGDGEEIIRDIALGLPLIDIAGISYRKDNAIVHNKSRDLIFLDDKIYPNRKLRQVNYRLLYKNIDLGLGIDFISTSRGCPFHCKFCTFTNNPLGQKRPWSARSARSVVEELKTVDAEFIFVVDDNFAVDMKRVEEICDLVIAEGIKKTFAVSLRLEIYKYPSVLRKMFAAGFKILSIGIESAQDKTLKSMEKGFDTSLAQKAFKEIAKINFYIHGYFIVGCVGESESEMLAIAPFAKRLKLDTISLSLLRTEKYSPLNEIIARSKEYHIGEKDMIYSDDYSSAKLKSIRHSISKSYYDFFTISRIIRKIFTARL